MKKYFVYIKTLLCLVILGAVFGFTSSRHSKREVSTIKINFSNEDNLFLTRKTVDNLLKQNGKHILNQPKSLINLQGLESQVVSHPMVSSAEVSVGVLGNVEVSVQQKKPLARMYNASEVYYVDSKGGKMPLSSNYSARVPIIDNKNGRIVLEEVFPLIDKLHSDLFLQKMIVAVKKTKEGYWLQTRFYKQLILLGSLEQTDRKLKKLKVFYNYAENDSFARTFKKIDLQYNNQVVCSK